MYSYNSSCLIKNVKRVFLFQPPNYFPQSHSSFGGSNIHVAFQNMSITTHPSNSHVQVCPGNPIPVPVNMPPSPEQISGDMSGHQNNRVNYMNEMYVPYFPNGKYGLQAPNPVQNDVSILLKLKLGFHLFLLLLSHIFCFGISLIYLILTIF